MSLLPAVVPEIPESRAEVVPARIARKVAPLFGVAWPGSPFGSRTWVSDYGRITLSEIARGAPLPRRAQLRELGDVDEGPWRVVDRFVVPGKPGSLPNEIANATLNRFGPDTKAAVVLTAVNKLLEPVTEAISQALQLIVGSTTPPNLPNEPDMPIEQRLAAWAGILVEVLRSQPALVAAGIRARTIQRELTVSWQLPMASGTDPLPLTRCEIDVRPEADHRETTYSTPDRPNTLDFADRTIDELQVLIPGTPIAGTDDASKLAHRQLKDETVDLLLRRLLAVGTPDSPSYLWLSRRGPEQLNVEALIHTTSFVDRFIGQAMRSLGDKQTDPAERTLPVVPPRAAVAALPVLGRRALVLGLISVLRYVQDSPEAREATRDAILPVLGEVEAIAVECLDADDPVGVLARCRVADMVVQTRRPIAGNDLRVPVAALRAATRRVHELFRAGVLDRGAAAEAISSANVELNAVRWSNARDLSSGLPRPEELHAELRENWDAVLDALEVHPPAEARAAGYHLHNYAAFLASPATQPGADPAAHTTDLREAYRLFDEVVLVARRAHFADTGVFAPYRTSLLIAARATTGLATTEWDLGHAEESRRWAARGLELVREALADSGELRRAPQPTEIAARFGLLAAPPLITALELAAPDAGLADLQNADELVRLAEDWQAQLREGARFARAAEVGALRRRLAGLGRP